jgi:6-phosphogluconolactonase (cycloisomerase 2 family)
MKLMYKYEVMMIRSPLIVFAVLLLSTSALLYGCGSDSLGPRFPPNTATTAASPSASPSAILQAIAPLDTSSTNLTAVALDPSGNFVLSGNAAGIHSYRIVNQATGQVSPVASLGTNGTPVAIKALTGPDGAEVLVVVNDTAGPGAVESFVLDPTTGQLTAATTNAQIGKGEPGTALAINTFNGSPVAYAGGQSTIQAFTVGNGGLVTELSTQNSGLNGFLTSLAVTKASTSVQVLYAGSNAQTSNVNGFLLAADGTFGSRAAGLPVTVGGGTSAITGMTSNFLAKTGAGGNVLLVCAAKLTVGSTTALTVNADGSLTAGPTTATQFLPLSPIVLPMDSTASSTHDLEPPGPEFVLNTEINIDTQVEQATLEVAINTIIDNPVLGLNGFSQLGTFAFNLLPDINVLITTGQLQTFETTLLDDAHNFIDELVTNHIQNQLTPDQSGLFVFEAMPEGLQPLVVLPNQSQNTGGTTGSNTTGANTTGTTTATGTTGTQATGGGTVIFAPNTGNSVSIFGVNANGSLTDLGSVPTTGSPMKPFVYLDGIYVGEADEQNSQVDCQQTVPVDEVKALRKSSTAANVVPGSPFSDGGGSSPVDGASNGSFLYVINQSSTPTISGFSINQTSGALTALSGSPFAIAGLGGGELPIHARVEPSNKYLYITTAQNIFGFMINGNGSLSQLNSGASLGTISGSEPPLITDASGKFLYVGQSILGNPNKVAAFGINSNGTLNALGNGFDGTNPPDDVRALMLSPSGGFLYAAGLNSGTQGGIGAWSIGSNGALSPVSGSPFQPSLSLFDATIDPTSGNIYATTLGQNLNGFSTSSSGAVAPLPGSPFSTAGFSVSLTAVVSPKK